MDVTTTITAIVGLIAGVVGTTLGVINYLRDAPRIAVSLQWGLQIANMPREHETLGMVSVVNTGRRPIFVSHAHLIGPARATDRKAEMLILRNSVPGKRLGEGDAPVRFDIPQPDCEELFTDLATVRAIVTDARGVLYCSRLDSEVGLQGRILYWCRTRGKRAYRTAQQA